MTNGTSSASEKIEIDLINYNNLSRSLKEGGAEIVENFVVDVNENNFQKVGEEKESANIVASDKEEPKSSFSILKKPSSSKSQPDKLNTSPAPNQGHDPSQVKPKNKVQFGQLDMKELEKTPGQLREETAGNNKNLGKIIKWLIFIVLILGILAAFFMLPQITGENKSSTQIISEYAQLVLDKIKNIKGIVFPQTQERSSKPTQVTPLPSLSPSPASSPSGSTSSPSPATSTPIIFEELNIQKSIARAVEAGHIGEIETTKREIGTGEEKTIGQEVWDELTEKEKKITQKGIYSFIQERSLLINAQTIYLLKIGNSQEEKIPFNELSDALEIKIPSHINEEVVDYEFMVFLESINQEAPNKIRLGLLLMFDEQNKPTFSSLKSWESTIIEDLNPLYIGENNQFIEQKPFQKSTISESRRYVNFNTNQSLSLDYALAQDGLVIVTSKNFGTTILNILLQE